VRTYAQVLASADVQASGLFETVDDGQGGQVQLPGLPFHFGTAPRRERPPAVPRLGQHTAEVLAQAGYGDADIAGLQRDGVVGVSDGSMAAA
jgi:crotonobetainyl-CoA:carnitine CoA-transferase CaiB-like acyl-CoA transferase